MAANNSLCIPSTGIAVFNTCHQIQVGKPARNYFIFFHALADEMLGGSASSPAWPAARGKFQFDGRGSCDLLVLKCVDPWTEALPTSPQHALLAV